MSSVITPRSTRLLRVSGFRALQRAVARAVASSEAAVDDTLVLVHSEGAADQLRRTLGSDLDAISPDLDAISIVTRGGLHGYLAQRLAEPPPMLDELAREVLFRRAAESAIDRGQRPPFEVRPGLIPEMLALYDALRRQHRTIDDFERLVGGALEAGADIDRGARRLLQQTQFLVAAFRAYEQHLDGVGALDEHALRARLLAEPGARPLRKIVVCVPDVRADAAGLWPADFDLLTRLPDLASIDLIATERLLATGYLERLIETLPEIELQTVAEEPTRAPVLIAPASTPRQEALHFTSRDREEELAMIAASWRPAADAADDDNGAPDAVDRLDRAAVVYQRPLPYLYLARQVFGAHAMPWQAMDALPLAAEPYAAALDLVLTFVASSYTRNASMALLRSPHFRFVGEDSDPPTAADIAACDAALREADYLGGRDRLADIVESWRRKAQTPAHPRNGASAAGLSSVPNGTASEHSHARAAAPRADESARGGTATEHSHERVAQARSAAAAEAGVRARASARPLRALEALLVAAEALAPLEVDALPSAHLETVEQFLLRHERLPIDDDSLAERQRRARGAVLGTLQGLRDAFLRHGERVGPFRDVAALVHRWIEGHTFNPRVGTSGVHLVDIPAAMFGRFERVALVGVLEGEWPSSSSRNVFYPASLLRDLSWPTEADRRTAARATFEDLLQLASDEVMVSTCALENDSIVRPSPFVEDLASAGLTVARRDPTSNGARPSALFTVPASDAEGARDAEAWAMLRAARSDPHERAYHGWTGVLPPRAYSVTGIDRYLQCPFKFFAGSVLRLDEEIDEQSGLTPLERGKFEHEVFQEFFTRWHGAGHGAIGEAELEAARATFVAVVEDLLPHLPFVEREIERTRLLGSAVSPGLGERIFRFEAARPLPIVDRLIEFALDGEYDLPSSDEQAAKCVRLRGVADRIDLLADGSLRLIDYKTGKGSGVNRTIQLPVYAFCAEERLAEHKGRRWRIGEAGYLAFGRNDPYILAIGAGDDPAKVVDPAIARLRQATDRIEAGEFPVTPVEPYRCVFCGYAAVCRKDYVGDS